MKNKRKLGQAIIEYVLLLIIPVLLLSVLPNLNKTVELTLNTVGVDLMEEEGQTPDTPTPTCDDEEICSPKILYPPVASMELPDNKDCNEKGVYRKGASIRIQDLSYDTDPDNSGTIDHLEWTVEKKAPSGAVVEECSTTVKNETLKLSRQFGGSSESTGLTIDMNGYGGITDYALCVRDPGTFTVTLKAFDNDGLLSSNVAIKTFEIRDLKPSIRLEVNVADGGTTIDGSAMKNIYSQSLSNTCAFDPKLEKGVNQSPQLDSNAQHEFTYRNVTYNYTEVCPKDTAIGRNGQVVFKLIENEGIGAGNKAFLTDPDFTATNYNGDVKGEGTPEGAENSLYGFDRHGFTYQSRFIQSSALIPEDINENNSQIITFKDGASEYTKEFENPGIYMFDAQVYDENLISSQTYGVQNKDNYKPDVGIAIKVLSPNDKNYAEKCGTPDAETITCPKPVYILGITRTIQGSNEKYGPFYFTFGQVGSVNASDLKSIKDEDGNKINIITDITELKNKLGGIDIALVPYISNGIKIPVFRPTTNDHLDIKGLTYFPKNEGSYEETDCPAAGTSRYWATSNGWNNSFDFNNTLIGKPNALWSNGENVGDTWFEIKRPYDENATEDLYYNINNVTSISKGMELKLGNEIIDHVELIYGQARNEAAEVDSETLGTDIIASPFTGSDKGRISTSKNYIEPLSNVKSQYYSKISGNDITYKNSYFRSNGQLIAIAPKLQSCPLHDQRPVPVFSYITTTDTIKTLNINTNGVSGLDTSNITWSIDTKNPPEGMYCTKEGCTVSITANDSVCGKDAKNCKINAIRWKFSPYTHEPYQGENDEDALTKATPVNPNSRLNRYFPLTNKVNGENSEMPYLKYDNLFYPIAKDNRFTRIDEPTTVSDSYDKFYNALATNNNLKGSYIYYGAYGSSEEVATEKGLNRSEVPTFDFVKKDSTMTMDQLRQTATVAPNGNTIYTDADIPNLPDGYESTNGLFLEAGSSYTYTIEIIDSQGCATSKTLTINISDSSKEPVAYCNFIEKEVPIDDIKNYRYYEGLLVQGRTPEGINVLVNNGDNINIEGGNNNLKLYTTPLYQYFENNTTFYQNYDNGAYFTTNDNNHDYTYNKNSMYEVPTQANITKDQYNPRIGQIGSGGNLYGILDAENSRIYDGATVEESREVFENPNSNTLITWKLYKAALPTDQQTKYTMEEYQQLVLDNMKDIGSTSLYGLNLIKVSDTPIATVTTNKLTEAPPFNNAIFSTGYYIVEVEVSYKKDGETLKSNPTECNLRVSTPKLDFKCPWGETIEELRNNELKIEGSLFGDNRPSDDMFKVFDTKNEAQNYFVDNHSPFITKYEITTNVSKDYNDLDTFENDNYSKVTLIDFDADKLNKKWQNFVKHGYYTDFIFKYICNSPDDDHSCEEENETTFEKKLAELIDMSTSWNPAKYEEILESVVKPLSLNKDSINPLSITTNGKTETMSLQGWILRERLFRDGESIDEENSENDYLTYAYAQNAPVTPEEANLINKSMTPEQYVVLDTFFNTLSEDSFMPELENVPQYKVLLASRFKYSPKNSFTFSDLQPGLISLKSWTTNDDNESWSKKYTGAIHSETGTMTPSANSNYSIRKGNTDFSNAYGILKISQHYNFMTPFYGKYEAARRFQDLNFGDFLKTKDVNILNYQEYTDTYTKQEQTNSENNNYNIANDNKNSMQDIRNEQKLRLSNYKNFYINPLSINLNNIGTTEENALFNLDKKFNINDSISSQESNVKFSTLPWSLSANIDALKTQEQSEYQIDRTTLNEITWLLGAKLGKYRMDEDTRYADSAITYVRVNTASEQVLSNYNNKTVYNNYSKLCPVMVAYYPPNIIKEGSCDITYRNPRLPWGEANPIKPNRDNGILINKDGTTYDWGYLVNSNYTRTNKSDNVAVDGIPAPKVKSNSTYNMGDLHLDMDNIRMFLNKNIGTNLYKATYQFYFVTATGKQIIPGATFDVIYDLQAETNAKGANLDASDIDRIAQKVYDSFEANYYKPGTSIPVIADKFKSAICKQDGTTFDFNEISYEVNYIYMTPSGELETMGGESTKSCSIMTAYEVNDCGNDKDYVLEIGSWSYRIEFKNHEMLHWDRTYDLEIAKQRKQYLSLSTPNYLCKWTSTPLAADPLIKHRSYNFLNDQTLYFGGASHSNVNEGCKVAGASTLFGTSTPKMNINTNSQANAKTYDILTEYTLGNSPGFYWAALSVTPRDSATYSEVANQCWYFVGGDSQFKKATNIVSSYDLKEDSNSTYWCQKATMYAKTDNYNVIPGLDSRTVLQVIMKDNGNSVEQCEAGKCNKYAKGLYDAVVEQLDNCYGNLGRCDSFMPRK